jgi:hypothetical protein
MGGWFSHACVMERTNRSAGEAIEVAKLDHFDADN